MEDILIVETFVQLCYQLPLPIILYRFSKIRDNESISSNPIFVETVEDS